MISQPIPLNTLPPGETLDETLESLGMKQTELARRTGLSTKTISRIITGHEVISQDTAFALEKVLKVPAHFWINLEARYREALAREQEAAENSKYKAWAGTFPYAKMAGLGLVPPTRKIAEKVRNLVNYFAVRDPDQWQKVYPAMKLELSYRKSPKVAEKIGTLSAWLRAGEIAAEQNETREFSSEVFANNLSKIRELTRRDVSEFVPRIQELCAEAGVVYCLVPELPGLGISGVMRWYRGRPMIQQTLRFKTADSFWFTFLHEARHVLQERKKSIFLEGQFAEQEDLVREADADKFARDLLIPQNAWDDFLTRVPKPGVSTIRKFAAAQSLHPGIVVGRLFREKRLDYGHPCRSLQCRLEWMADG